MVEILIADKEVSASNLGAPFGLGRFGIMKP